MWCNSRCVYIGTLIIGDKSMFVEMKMNELDSVDGGIAASAVCAIAGSVCYIGAGVAALAGNDDLAAGLTIAGGCCDVAAGVCMLLP